MRFPFWISALTPRSFLRDVNTCERHISAVPIGSGIYANRFALPMASLNRQGIFILSALFLPGGLLLSG
jgi:hypothetical protein